MSSVIEYETEKWRSLQSKFTSVLALLEKNKKTKKDINQTDLLLHKLLTLNSLADQMEVVLDELKYECIYSNSKYNNHKKIQTEIKQHLLEKKIINDLLVRSWFK